MDNTRTNEDIARDAAAIRDKVAEFVRHSAFLRLKNQADCPDVDVRTLADDFVPGRILANNMAFILISGDSVRITFKVHFNLATAKNLAFRVFGGESAEDIPVRQAFDYVKEYCNLVAGNVVSLFENVGVDLGISLPLCTRGFYEVFSDYAENDYPVVTYSRFWRLQANENVIFCSARFELLNRKSLTNLIGFEIPEETIGDSEIEFLWDSA